MPQRNSGHQSEGSLADRTRSRVRRGLADAYDPSSLSGKSRARRWQKLAGEYPNISAMRVIDLGGDLRSWVNSKVRPLELTLVNTFDQRPNELWIKTRTADVCDMPLDLLAEEFDLVYCNSVIEHVGGHWRRTALADAVHRLGPRHWIQTPYRYFPVEPHVLVPGLQFLPLWAQAQTLMRWPLVSNPPTTFAEAVGRATDADMLSLTEMRLYFPSSEIRHERLGGLTKSLTAVA